jgi:hypothetical protein
MNKNVIFYTTTSFLKTAIHHGPKKEMGQKGISKKTE